MMTWLNAALGVLITGLGLLMIDRMTRGTQCGIRWGVVLITVGGLFAVIGNLWEWEPWTDTALLGGVATYLLANMRAPLTAAVTSWGRSGAYVVAIVTVIAVVFAWGA